MYFIFELNKDIDLNLKSFQLNEQILKSEIQSYDQMINTEKKIRKMHHDMKHLVSVTLNNHKPVLNENEEWVPVNSENHVINYVLNTKRKEAFDQNIDCVCILNFNHSINIETSDLFLLLSNMLDNAIKYVGTEKKIMVLITDDNNLLKIYIRNSVDEITKKESGSVSHGYGIATIKEITEKYEGILTTSVEDGYYAVQVLFPLSVVADKLVS